MPQGLPMQMSHLLKSSATKLSRRKRLAHKRLSDASIPMKHLRGTSSVSDIAPYECTAISTFSDVIAAGNEHDLPVAIMHDGR
jgi:hypothetical protein